MDKAKAIKLIEAAIDDIQQGKNIEQTVLVLLATVSSIPKNSAYSVVRIPAWEGGATGDMIGPALPRWNERVAIDFLNKLKGEFSKVQL